MATFVTMICLFPQKWISLQKKKTNQMERNILKALLLCPLFKGFTSEEIQHYMANVPYRLVRLDKKDIFTLTGEPSHHVDIVILGALNAKMFVSSGKSVRMTEKTSGSILAPAYIFSADHIAEDVSCYPPASHEYQRADTHELYPARLQCLRFPDQEGAHAYPSHRTGEGGYLLIGRSHAVQFRYFHADKVAPGNRRPLCHTEILTTAQSQRICQ